MFSTKKRLNNFDGWMMAITFAEVGERETVNEAIRKVSKKRNGKRMGIKPTSRVDHRPVLRV